MKDDNCIKVEEDNILILNEMQISRIKKDFNGIENGRKLSKCLSREGVSVTWENLTINVEIKDEKFFKSSIKEKEIIHNVTGAVRPGNLVAILGASGSGKSTLMSALANRPCGGLKINGNIRIGGKELDKNMRDKIGFVYQHDLFITSLTAREHLTFAAKMKLDRRTSKEEIKGLIDDIVKNLGLSKCENVIIGGRKEKINLSGGEQKRLSVALELLTDPPLLFCDEPTTGLDSYSSLKVVTNLKSLSNKNNKTIICSIHQPNEKIFMMFDHIVLLYKGNITYMGPTGSAIPFFRRNGFICPPFQNPADFLVKTLAVIPGHVEECEKKVTKLCENFNKSEFCAEIQTYIMESRKQIPWDFEVEKCEPPTWISKFMLLNQRSFLTLFRNPKMNGVPIIQKVFIALLTGICMSGAVSMDQKGIQGIQGAIFSLLMEVFFSYIYQVIDHIPQQLPLFKREYYGGTNTPLIFFLTYKLSSLPVRVLGTTLFCLIMYYIVGLRDTFFAFGMTCLVCNLIASTSSSFGNMISIAINDIPTVFSITGPIDQTLTICSGMFISVRSIPQSLMWIRYISWLGYGYEILLVLQFQGLTNIACDPDAAVACLKTGTEVINKYGFEENNLWSNVIYIAIINIVLDIACYIILVFKIRIRK